MRILTALLAFGMMLAPANAQRVTAWFLTVPGDNPNLPGHVREIPGTIFASRAKCQAEAKHHKKLWGGRRVCMKIKTDKDTITNP
jgi:hypothetical protein